MDFDNIGNYRSFIREYLARKPQKGRGEIARLALSIGVHSTFVSQVLAGSKDFNLEQSFAVAEYLELTETERKYFLLLVQKDRAGTHKLKNYFKGEIDSLKSSLLKVSNRLNENRTLTDTEKSIFYSSWLYSSIRLFCSIESGKTLEEIVAYFEISRTRVLKILDFLCDTNLCIKENERYQMGSQHTHLPSDSAFIVKHHMNWRTKALQLHEGISEDELAFTSPVSVSKKDFNLIREKLIACIKDSIEVVKASDSEEVAFLNIDWLRIKSQK